jgi:Carboxypeptidase regulatory-like domain
MRGILDLILSSHMRLLTSILVLAATILFGSVLCGQSQQALKGVVHDISGAVIPDARVGIFSMDQAEETISDRYGKFIFTNLAPGTYELEASYPGFIPTIVENVQIPTTETEPLKISLPPFGTPPFECGKQPPASYEISRRKKKVGLSGLAEDIHGVPVPQAQLSLSRLGDVQVATTQRTNAKGEFEFPNLGPGKYTLSGKLAGYSALPPTNFWVTRSGLTKVTFMLLKTGQGIICQ